MDKKYQLIIVDDDADMIEAIERILRNPSYEISTYTSAEAALNTIRDAGGKLDLILSDNRMPGMNGVDFLVTVRKEFPDIVRIMLTGQSDLEDAKIAINEGKVFMFLTKPCEAQELRSVVKKALEEQESFLKQRHDLEGIRNSEEDASTRQSGQYGSFMGDMTYGTSLDEYLRNRFKDMR